MSFYRKKPVPVEARQYTGDNFLELMSWSNSRVTIFDINGATVYVNTLEGPMRFDVGDYIIKGVHGEFYPCCKDIFDETYERI